MLVFNSSSYITDYMGSPSPNSWKIKICMEKNGLTLLNFRFCFCTFNDTTIYPDTNLYVIVAVVKHVHCRWAQLAGLSESFEVDNWVVKVSRQHWWHCWVPTAQASRGVMGVYIYFSDTLKCCFLHYPGYFLSKNYWKS